MDNRVENQNQTDFVAESNRLSYEHAARKKEHANRIYWVLLLYVIVVALNAGTLLVLFILNLLSIVEVPYSALSAWAVGTGGLGAGSLIFRMPMKSLFEISSY